MLRNYMAPDGRTYQYEEGEQPMGYVLAEAVAAKQRAAQGKRRAAQNKRRDATTKGG